MSKTRSPYPTKIDGPIYQITHPDPEKSYSASEAADVLADAEMIDEDDVVEWIGSDLYRVTPAGPTCHMCSCYGLVTASTTERTIRDLGTCVDWRGDVVHPVCATCAREHDAAVAPRGPFSAEVL